MISHAHPAESCRSGRSSDDLRIETLKMLAGFRRSGRIPPRRTVAVDAMIFPETDFVIRLTFAVRRFQADDWSLHVAPFSEGAGVLRDGQEHFLSTPQSPTDDDATSACR